MEEIKTVDKKKEKYKKLLYFITALTIAVIWGQSCIGKEQSKANSDIIIGMIKPIEELEPGYRSENGWTFTQLSQYVRKGAHLMEYAVLSAELSLILIIKKRKHIKGFAVCFLLCSMIALIDESIQVFSGRSGEIQDIWIDNGGALTGILITNLICLVKIRLGKRKKEGEISL